MPPPERPIHPYATTGPLTAHCWLPTGDGMRIGLLLRTERC
jgi:hypothetical protein